MKLLFEHWRRFLKEEGTWDDPKLGGWEDTAAMEKGPRQMATAQLNRVKETLGNAGLYLNKELGTGQFGTVYEVQDKKTGRKLAAKIVKTEDNRETENYQFAMENKASMPKEYGKYLPEVHEITPAGEGYNIILMEKLLPLPPQVAQELFATQSTPSASQKPQRILKNPEATAEIAQQAVQNNRILGQMQLSAEQRRDITKSAVNSATKSTHADVDSFVDTVYGAVTRVTEFQSPAINKAFNKALRDDILYYFDKQIVPVHQPEPDDEDIETWTSGALEKTKGLFPEAEGLMKAMKYFMQDQQWRPKDVHAKNVMMRPGTNDFVIVDLGLFQRGLFEGKLPNNKGR